MDAFDDLRAFMADHSEMKDLGQRLLDDHEHLKEAFFRGGGEEVVVLIRPNDEYFCTTYFEKEQMDLFRDAVGPTDDWERDFGRFIEEAIRRAAGRDDAVPSADEADPAA